MRSLSLLAICLDEMTSCFFYQWRKIRNSFACFSWILFLLCSLFMSTF